MVIRALDCNLHAENPLYMKKLLSCLLILASINVIAAPPANDNCAAAVNVTPGTPLTTTLFSATATGSIPVDCATGNPDDDVWYKFTAVSPYVNILITGAGTKLAQSGIRLQLFSGGCGSLTTLACGQYQLSYTNLTAGTVYLFRVYSAGALQPSWVAADGAFTINITPVASTQTKGGRMGEIFNQTILSTAAFLNNPWEITYGYDGYLWVTESKGYRAYRIDPNTGHRDTLVDLSQGSTFFSAPADQAFNMQFNIGTYNPQGGFAGLVLHPQFMSTKKYVYISYVHTMVSDQSVPKNGVFYQNRIVRFTYNTTTGKLESPVSVCDTLPGSSDHNSQRMIIAPVGGTDYLFYGQGDMGTGQFANTNRTNHAQDTMSYEGKILRFNLEPDGDVGTYDKWIPNDNPYSGVVGKQSAAWAIGIRNNQGFAYDSVNDVIFASTHGPMSDDEINVINRGLNYGHPYIIGKSGDNNYNGCKAAPTGAPDNALPPIVSESAKALEWGANYKDPLFSGYDATPAWVTSHYTTPGGNNLWPSEAWSGIDYYPYSQIPGWKNSLLVSGLKWARMLRLKLNSTSTTVLQTAGADTSTFFGGRNRMRDLAINPLNPRQLFTVSDNSTTTNGPRGSAVLEQVAICGGCIVKYDFLGYTDAAGKSSIPNTIPVTSGTANSCNTANSVVIDASNNNIWVPITGQDGNILAEIYANGNNLGTVTASYWINSGAIRIKSGVHLLDRNLTITPAVQPSSAVKIRLYFSKAEYDALDADALSGVSAITDLKILKNSDPCSATVGNSTTLVNPTFSEAFGSNGYMLQGSITSFSSFYFGIATITLPLDMVNFTGSLQRDQSALLNWKTEHEVNTAHFVVERSVDGMNFSSIGTVTAKRNTNTASNYDFTDRTTLQTKSPVLYYRLKIVDIDGAFKYSNIVVVSLPGFSGSVSLMPNPVKTDTKVTVIAANSGVVEWSLLDNAGKVIMKNTSEVKKDTPSNILINMNGLASGMYFLRVEGAGLNVNTKVQKL